MTEDITPEQQKIISSAWHQFFIATTTFDSDHNKPNGWSWFWCLYDIYNHSDELPNLEPAAIKSKLHNQHWLKTNTTEVGEICDVINGHVSGDSEFLNPVSALLHNLGKANLPISPNIDFSGITFKDDTDFSNIIFPVDTDFSKAEFSKDALFSNATFLDTALFKNTKFNGERAKFKSTIFKKMVDFSNATFKHYANFANATFDGRISFLNATFERHVPRLYRATLNKEIIWDNVNWPTFPNLFWALWQDILRRIKSKYADMTYVKNVRENQNAYEDLANHMEDLNKYHDQHLFFRLEMGCRRRLENYFTRLFYWLYERLSNYGYGVEYAIKAWFWHILICALILFAIRAFNRWNISLEDFGCSLGISLSNSHAFFFKGDRLAKCYETFEYLPWFNFIWGSQTIVGTLLIFLVLLTLRVRFRLK